MIRRYIACIYQNKYKYDKRRGTMTAPILN